MSFDLPSIIGFVIPWSLVVSLAIANYMLLGWSVSDLIQGDFLNLSIYMLLAYLIWFFLRKPFSFFLKVLNKQTPYTWLWKYLFGKSCSVDPRDKMFGKRILVEHQVSLFLKDRKDHINHNDIYPHTVFYLILSRVKQQASSSILNGIDWSFHQFTLASKLCTVFSIYIINFLCLLLLIFFNVLHINIRIIAFALPSSYLLLRLSFSLLRKSYLDRTKAVINAFLVL